MAKVEADPATSIESTLKEKRVFRPPKAFSAKAHIKSMAQYERMYRESVRNPEKFWGRVAEELEWFKKWRQVMQWKLPFAKWFVGGKTNICYNCLDRHLETPRKNKAALIWEGEPGEVRTLTYQQLHHEVCKFANVLKILEIKKGDRVVIYMGMVPELPIAMLACARIGAVHSVVFGGFSADALRDRTNDAQAVAVITQDGAFRRGTEIRLKSSVDEALKEAPSVRNVIVFRRSGTQVNMEPGRDHWWHELVKAASEKCPAEPLDSEHILFTLYTSGTTGKPKGVVHTTGGYMVYVYLTTKYVFDLTDEDTYWCTADIGWVTGHSYILYGPLLNGATKALPIIRILTDSGRSSSATRSTSSTRPRLRFAPSPNGATSGPRSMTSPACAFSVPWASRSIPKPGCGTKEISARGAAPLWTRGGRQRREVSSSHHCPEPRRPSPAPPRAPSSALSRMWSTARGIRSRRIPEDTW